MDAAIVLGLVVLAMVLFAIERVPMQVTALALIVLLAISGVLTPEEAFSGLANDTVIFIFALLSMTQALVSTGVMQIVGRRISFMREVGERSFLAVVMGVVAGFSSLASNTAVTAAFLPIVSTAAARAEIPRSRVLLPMAYSSMLGGMIFLFGTSTNLIVSEAMVQLGMPPIGFAELTPAGLPVAIIAIALLVFSNRYLVPTRWGENREPPIANRQFVTEAALPQTSRLIGRTISEIGSALDFEILGLIRRDLWIAASSPVPVRAGDRLVIRGGRHAILRVKDLRSLVLDAELQLEPEKEAGEPTVLAEAFVPPHSPLIGRTMREFLFSERFGLLPLAVHRHPTMRHAGRPEPGLKFVWDIRLAAGDVLLVSGPQGRLRELSDGQMLSILGSVDYRRPRYRRALLATLIFATTLAVAAVGIVPAAIAGLIGVIAMIATRCVDVVDAFRIEWRILLLIASLLGLGMAMERSGAGALIAEALVPLGATVGARGLLFVIMLITVLLSAPMSNQAAALVVLPVAVQVALILQVDPRPFAIATCLAASCSFMTPLEPAAALVYGPGHYRFSDFLRAGTPVTLLLLAMLTAIIPIVWPL